MNLWFKVCRRGDLSIIKKARMLISECADYRTWRGMMRNAHSKITGGDNKRN